MILILSFIIMYFRLLRRIAPRSISRPVLPNFTQKLFSG